MKIINARVLTMASDGKGGYMEYFPGYVAWENGKITAAGPMTECSQTEDAIDAAGKYICPGFIDGHSHIGICEDSLGFEGDDVNEMTEPSTPQLRVIDAVNPFDICFSEALEAGVTCAVVCPGSANPIGGQTAALKTWGNCVDDMIVRTPVSMKMALGENPKSVYHERKEMPMTRMATASVIREQLTEAKKYMEKLNAGEDMDYDAACEALIPLLKREIPAHIHAHRADDICTAIRLAKEFSFDFVIIHGTQGYQITDVLKKNNVKVMCGPLISERCKPELRELTPAAPGMMEVDGVEVAIITDHPVVPVQYLSVCAALAAREGMAKDAALASVTSKAAQIAGIADRVGSIEPGKDADLCVFGEYPLNFTAKPETVIIDGEIRYRKNERNG